MEGIPRVTNVSLKRDKTGNNGYIYMTLKVPWLGDRRVWEPMSGLKALNRNDLL